METQPLGQPLAGGSSQRPTLLLVALAAGAAALLIATIALIAALTGGGDGGVGRRELVGVPLSVPAGQTRTLSARCPEGMASLGGGFETLNPQVDVLASTPFFAGDGWRVRARNQGDTSATVFINVVCGEA